MTIGSIPGIAASSIAPLTRLADTATTAGATGPQGKGFGDAVVSALDDLSAKHNTVDGLAVQAATGQLPDVHDYTIAATEASLATELTVAVRNKAVEAFTQIMNLPL